MDKVTEIFTVKPNTINQLGNCKVCGWAVIFACCNDGFADHLLNEDGSEAYADWWAYCSNKSCEHHHGEDAGQDTNYHEWVIPVSNE